MFSKFQVRYGHKWTSALDSDELVALAVQEWGEILGGLTPEQIRHGLQGWQGAWPPSAVEFRQACIGSVSDLHRSAAYRPFVALPSPPGDAQTAASALAGMRASLRA